MANNIAKNAVERTSDELLGKVFPNLGKVAGEASRTAFSAVVRTGSALVTDLANVRELLRMERTRFISGRPKKRRPPDPTAFLPGFAP